MNSGRLKVFPSLAKYLEERRLYRRDEKEQIVKDRDNLQDAVRCLVNGISSMRTKPVKLEPASPEYGGSSGWMEWSGPPPPGAAQLRTGAEAEFFCPAWTTRGVALLWPPRSPFTRSLTAPSALA